MGSTTDQNLELTDNGINPSDVQNQKVYKALNAYVGAIANGIHHTRTST